VEAMRAAATSYNEMLDCGWVAKGWLKKEEYHIEICLGVSMDRSLLDIWEFLFTAESLKMTSRNRWMIILREHLLVGWANFYPVGIKFLSLIQ
jgi:hypothetical protein